MLDPVIHECALVDVGRAIDADGARRVSAYGHTERTSTIDLDVDVARLVAQLGASDGARTTDARDDRHARCGERRTRSRKWVDERCPGAVLAGVAT